ncbi:hypothetical protein [Flavisolibacter ginsengisoli]|jgi:hypothetical protein|uniref:Uncharacterized protein n=1 Tax=Flavisolibacter ginsengisoli DSM 18119 TaxID=1121884 RepID=A0A1M5CFG3_9BACT|nr:hypothetical protein [Flavisolibacter ginsengisoli]SHF53439.1 hypothetical protein SAMN02745131_02918 [Flavisolibacter ginsengisoli DSM 18119]
MSVPYVTCAPTEKDVKKLILLMSVFGDGSGQERDSSGTRAGWKDLERVISELLGGSTLEKKQVFDVIVDQTLTGGNKYGISLKTKCLGTESKIQNLQTNGRVYMELTNSPAKLWAPLKAMGIHESDFGIKNDQEIGNSILHTVHNWYLSYCLTFNIELKNSVHITISYGEGKKGSRLYQAHSFPLGFPDGIIWKFKSNKCLRGYDPAFPDEVLFDWYGLSGGQLKYYPRASTALYSSSVFRLLSPDILTITEKSRVYWPQEWQDLL